MSQQEYVHRTELKKGTLIYADEGFRCLDPHELCPVEEDSQKQPYVICQCGLHYLTGDHLDSRGRVVGFFKCNGLN